MTDEELSTLLEAYGWEIECYSPFEIRHLETGSFATMLAADCVVAMLHNEENED